MMDANELANVAIDAMPLEVLVEIDRGQVWGVLQMALRIQEAQHAEQLRLADEELQDARRRWEAATQTTQTTEIQLGDLRIELDAMRQDRDKLSQQCDLMAAELDAKQRELDEVRSQLAERRDATNHLAACVTGRDMAMSKLWRIVDDKADAYTSQEIYRAFRKWEASLRAMPPGADTVANTDELHGMAKVHLVPAGSEDL